MNSIQASRIGRYAMEVRDEEVRRARVVVVDFHWGICAPAFDLLVRHVRRLNPGVPIIVGGIAAGHVAHELLERGLVDYVLRGDSEVSFALLVEALLEGREPGRLPNVVSLAHPSPPRSRMSHQQFSATDSVSTSWFPTFNAYADWVSKAFSHGRFIACVRGCVMRCPVCYGGVRDIFGAGVLQRDPQDVVRLLRRVEELGNTDVHLFLGRISHSALQRLAQTLADAGPFRFSHKNVELMTCTPPRREDVENLEKAFPRGVILGFIAPNEFVPALSAETVASEMDLWRDVHERYLDRGLVEPQGATLVREGESQEPGDGGGLRDRETLPLMKAYSWEILRPTGPEGGVGYRELLDANWHAWTFDAARLLSPPIEQAAAVFGGLDMVTEDPEEVACPEGLARSYWFRLLDGWRRYRIPQIPGLSFVLVAVESTRAAVLSRRTDSVSYEGIASVAGPRLLRRVRGHTISPLRMTRDHRWVRLSAVLPRTDETGRRRFAVVPTLGSGRLQHEDVERALAESTVVLSIAHGEAHRIEIQLVLQQARIRVLDEREEVLDRGRIDLGHYVPRSRRTRSP